MAPAGSDQMRRNRDVVRLLDTNAPHTDRRRKVRLPLAWTVYLSRPRAGGRIETLTRNISSEGLYCVVDEPFVVGEVLCCTLMIPTFDPEVPDRMMALGCETKVVRVECAGTTMFGVAFHIRALGPATGDLGRQVLA